MAEHKNSRIHRIKNNMMVTSFKVWAVAALSALTTASSSEYILLEGHKNRESYHSPLPIEYVDVQSLPDNFSWGDQDGISYLTRSLNQHIPHYCGSCWAHGALSALADRIKIARMGEGPDISLSIQYILNCGRGVAGSCHGGSASGVYDFVKAHSGYVPYETCMPYLACSHESREGFCRHVDTTCKPINTCRTCDTFTENGGTCTAIDDFPKATIAEHGNYSRNHHAVMAEIYKRGPVAAGINALPIETYQGGIVKDHRRFHKNVNHIVSIVGWGTEEDTGTKYWIVRNSWGQYWGEMGFFRIVMGENALGIESEVSWATPGTFAVSNKACDEDGTNCSNVHGHIHHHYKDPSLLEEHQVILNKYHLH